MPNEEVIEQKNYRVGEVAKLFRVTSQTIRNRIKDGVYPHAFKDGKLWLIPAVDLQATMQKRYGENA